MSELTLWWGYKHVSGTLHAKRYFGHEDIVEARNSSFCEKIISPFHADTREEALVIIKEKTS